MNMPAAAQPPDNDPEFMEQMLHELDKDVPVGNSHSAICRWCGNQRMSNDTGAIWCPECDVSDCNCIYCMKE